MSLEGAPLVSICIPVFNGAAFVSETIDCALSQTHPRLEILISVDRSDDGSADICARFEGDRRVTVFRQDSRLGWVENTNFLIDRAGGDFFCVLPHDDLVPSDYVSRLLDALKADDRAINACPSISCFGDLSRRLKQRSIVGDRLSRVLDVVRHQRDAIPFRGLVRGRLPARARRLPRGLPGNLAADQLQVLHHALHGSIVAVDDVVYRKRYHRGSEHAAWRRLPRADWAESWSMLAARMAIDSLPHFDAAQHQRIIEACRRRALGMAPRAPLRLLVACWKPAVRAGLLSRFDEAVRVAG